MSSPLFSIIIPVYNVEQFLERCIYSIINQNYSNYEIILINDGSTDKSGSICDRLAQEIRNLKVIHINNAGVSNARNNGIQASSGEYIIFMDSDDYWCDNNILYKFKTIIEVADPDIIRGEYKAVDIKGNTLFHRTELPGKKECSNKIIDNFTFLSQAVQGEFFTYLYLFKKSILSGIQMDVRFKCFEDIDFIARLFTTPHKNYYIQDIFYAYTKRKDSLSNDINLEKLSNSFSLCYTFHKNAQLIQNNPSLLNYYYKYSIMMYYWTLDGISDFRNYRQVVKQLHVEEIRQDVLTWMKGQPFIIKHIIHHLNPVIACKYFRIKKNTYNTLYHIYKMSTFIQCKRHKE